MGFLFVWGNALSETASTLNDKVQGTKSREGASVTFEEEADIIAPLAEIAQEATGSMGDDTPMPVLSSKNRSIYDYFRQQFAQVTNPPIDSLREASVMSLEVCIGKERNYLRIN